MRKIFYNGYNDLRGFWVALIVVACVGGFFFGMYKIIDNSNKSECKDRANQYQIDTTSSFFGGCDMILNDGVKINDSNWRDVAHSRGWLQD